jgi:hypothetical protein
MAFTRALSDVLYSDVPYKDNKRSNECMCASLGSHIPIQREWSLMPNTIFAFPHFQ